MEYLKNHTKSKSGWYKTVCTSAVLAYFGIHHSTYRRCSRKGDVERILRFHGYSVRSRLSKIGKNKSVGQARARIRDLNESGLFYVIVCGHGMLLDSQGYTVVDTAPRKRDRRVVLAIYRITPRRD